MLSRLIHRVLMRHHYWRHIGFSELAELYASRMMRMLAISMIGVLLAIYLFQHGYGLLFISLYLAAYFFLRVLISLPLGFLVARIGPKRATLISNILHVPALVSLAGLSEGGIGLLVVYGLIQAVAFSLYDISYHVNFSKVSHRDHAGKEIGYMHMIERVVTGISPLVGGIIAYLFGPEATLFVASGLFLLAALPLFASGEPVRTHQHIMFRGINWRMIRPGLVAHMAAGADLPASGVYWSLFVAIVIFGTSGNAVYAQIGALASVTLLVSLIFTRLYGLLIDHRRGGLLLQVGVVGNALTHLARVFVTTPAGVITTNITNEAATTAYAMPFTKGIFDVADSLPGYRIAYLSLMSASAAMGGAIFSLVLAGLVVLVPNINQAMQLAYVFMALFALLILRHRFPALSAPQHS